MDFNNIFSSANDTDKALQSGNSNVKFGLNKATITSIDYVEDAGKDKSPGIAVDLILDVDGKEFKRRIYDVTGPLFGKSGTQVQPDDPEYKPLWAAAMKQVTATITHFIKTAGVKQEAIDTALGKAKPTSFEAFAQVMVSLLPKDYKGKEVDVFLEYQWSISPKQTRTFLEIPKNMKGGRFLFPHIKEEFEEINDPKTGLCYVNKEGKKHPFERSVYYMDSPKAKMQSKEAEADPFANVNLDSNTSSEDEELLW